MWKPCYTMLYQRIQPSNMNCHWTQMRLFLKKNQSYSMIQAPWYLCQRLWSGNRSSCQTGTFCPDIKCLSAGHRCNLLAQTFTLTIQYFFASHVHVKRESETYFVWVTHLCWPPWITYDTGHLSLITGKDRIDVCLIRKLKKTKTKQLHKVWF